MRLTALFAFGLLLSLGAGCRPPSPSPAVVANATQVEHTAMAVANTLGPGDTLEVRVFREKDLSGAFRLSPDGTIDYPLCGKVHLQGLSQSQAADALRECLMNGYVRNPQVTVVVQAYDSKKVFVFGQVNKAGTFPFQDRMTVVQAITLAGGFTSYASKNGTTVTRSVDGKDKRIKVPVEDIAEGKASNFVLRPGDIVFVPESFF